MRLALQLVLAALAPLAPGAETGRAADGGTVTPAIARVFVPAGETRSHRVRVQTAEITTMTPLDLLFLFDCSASMDGQLESVRKQAARILAAVKRAHPDSRFAVASFSDYPGLHSRDWRDYPWRLDQPFSADAEAARAAFDRIQILHGGDPPESYARALFEAARLEWRVNARRIVVLFGDSIAHATDPGPDGRRGTEDDLRLDEVASDLASRGISVIGVYENKSPAVHDEFNRLAQATGGRAIPLSHGAQAARATLAGLAQRLAVQPRLVVAAADADWVAAIAPSSPPGAQAADFDVILSVPPNTAPGRRRVQLVALRASDSGEEIGRAQVEIVTGWINSPALHWTAAAAAVLLPLVLAWRLLRLRETWVDAYYFNAPARWFQLAKAAATLMLAAAYVASVGWACATLSDPAAPPLSELVQLVAVPAQQARR